MDVIGQTGLHRGLWTFIPPAPVLSGAAACASSALGWKASPRPLPSWSLISRPGRSIGSLIGRPYRKYTGIFLFPDFPHFCIILNLQLPFWAKPSPENGLLGETVTQESTFGRNHHPKMDFWAKPSPKNRLLGETVAQKLTFGRNHHPKTDFWAKPSPKNRFWVKPSLKNRLLAETTAQK